MRSFLLRGAIILSVLAVPAVALAASHSGRVDVSNCNKESYKPKTIISTTCNGGDSLVKMKWSAWTTKHATGKGQFELLSCNPSCAAGKLYAYAAKATLSDPKACHKSKQGPNERYRVFTKLKVTYTTKRRPPHANDFEHFKLDCPFS